MSSLILPKHWRFNMPLLMGHLKRDATGHLTRTATEHLAKCSDCLCEDFLLVPDCGCQEEDYGPFLTYSDFTITVAGSTTPTELVSKGGTCGFSFTGATGPSIAGTYVIPCDYAGGCWWHAVPVGCVGGGGQVYYYVAGIRLLTSTALVSVRLYHQLVIIAGANPFPTVTGPTTCSPLIVTDQWTRDIEFGSTVRYDKWRYIPSSECREECNESELGAFECLSGTITAYSDTNSGSPDPCGGITVSVDVDAPT